MKTCANFLSFCLNWLMCRPMKKYKKDFEQNLSCALLIMKRDNSMQHLRGPRETNLCGSCVRCTELNQL